jgi:hypothetical protein
MEVELRE